MIERTSVAPDVVVEVGPGLHPVKFAYMEDCSYIGIDPDMHYLVANGWDRMRSEIISERKTWLGFAYYRGYTLGDIIGKKILRASLVVMANVLGDSKTYKAEYSGLFVDPLSGETRETDISTPLQLVRQAYSCVEPDGCLVIIEDKDDVRDRLHQNELQTLHKTMSSVDNVGPLQIFSGQDYRELVGTLYHANDIPNDHQDGAYGAVVVGKAKKCQEM
jgi:hypothetical protein